MMGRNVTPEKIESRLVQTENGEECNNSWAGESKMAGEDCHYLC